MMTEAAQSIVIRPADVRDADAIGHVHYYSWIETYTDYFSDDVMRGRSLERSVEMAKTVHAHSFVAVVDQRVVAFATYGPSRDEDLPDAAEIRAVYVLEPFQGRGIGKRLMSACYEALSCRDPFIVWVLELNKKTVDFYSAQGFVKDGRKKTLYERTIIRMVKKAE